MTNEQTINHETTRIQHVVQGREQEEQEPEPPSTPPPPPRTGSLGSQGKESHNSEGSTQGESRDGEGRTQGQDQDGEGQGFIEGGGEGGHLPPLAIILPPLGIYGVIFNKCIVTTQVMNTTLLIQQSFYLFYSICQLLHQDHPLKVYLETLLLFLLN